MATKQEIINDFTNYIVDNSPTDMGWYVGVTNDVEERLFAFHNVKRNGGSWIYDQAPSPQIALEIEKYFLENGATGGPGPAGGHAGIPAGGHAAGPAAGPAADSDIVYVYEITGYTRQGEV